MHHSGAATEVAMGAATGALLAGAIVTGNLVIGDLILTRFSRPWTAPTLPIVAK
jgi:ABC-type spermidine/putrescine transport system permease subunit II